MPACAVPLAPGYKIVKGTRDVHFVAGASAKLEIHDHYVVQNSGTTPLLFIDLNFPEERSFGRRDLRVELDGRAAGLAELPEEYRPDHPNALRLVFDSPWPRSQSHNIDIEYSLSSPEDRGSRITIDSEAFHLGSRGWSAVPQPPHHVLSPFPRRPDKIVYSVRVPSNFLVLARGKMSGRKARGNETQYLFQLLKQDLAPFIVAGRYTETPFRQEAGSVVFWTLAPLKSDLGSGPARIARAWATLQEDFGPLDPNIRVPHVVESPSLRSLVEEPGPAAASFPGGALVNEETLALGIASDEFVEHVSHALAHNWFGDQMYPRGAAGLGMTEGLPEYATIVIDEAANGRDAREKSVRDYLGRYESAIQRGPEKSLGVTSATDNPEQRAIALAKAPLMYVALEDMCGEAPVRNGLKDLVTLYRGQDVGFDDMRAAIEQRCGKDLGEFFRTWLFGKGLPSDFRARYEPSSR
jgi:Peptidase family M1 domain